MRKTPYVCPAKDILTQAFKDMRRQVTTANRRRKRKGAEENEQIIKRSYPLM